MVLLFFNSEVEIIRIYMCLVHEFLLTAYNFLCERWSLYKYWQDKSIHCDEHEQMKRLVEITLDGSGREEIAKDLREVIISGRKFPEFPSSTVKLLGKVGVEELTRECKLTNIMNIT
ncbi:hypothetical protein ACFE04_028899 [Oxalis oulophora]